MERNTKTIFGKIKRINHLKDRTDTYDIQTPNENFFANGILVHNSEIILRDKEFCNLTEVVVRADDTVESLQRKVRLATILGTWQSTLVNFKYISGDWTKNCVDERLLGVSMTGIMDSEVTRSIKGLDNRLKMFRSIAIRTNKEHADILDIPQSAAITCVKPSGCGTLDTKIKTTNGEMTFEEIFEMSDIDPFVVESGTFVEPSVDIFVYDENNDERKITNLYVKGYSPVYEIEDEYGNVYEFSSEHKLLTSDGWNEVRLLTEEDEILSFDPLENVQTLYNYSVSNQGEGNESKKIEKIL